MKVFSNTPNKIFFASWVHPDRADEIASDLTNVRSFPSRPHRDALTPLRNWLENIQIQDRRLAHRLCKLIPAQCPFERDVVFLGKKLFHIPPMCKLNPLYEELVGIRFRALCYLADECQEDISQYC